MHVQTLWSVFLKNFLRAFKNSPELDTLWMNSPKISIVYEPKNTYARAS